MDREQRLVFGEVADVYDRARPRYPSALYDTIVDLSGAAPGDPVLEIGAGTGIATRALAERGFHVVALEPDVSMAAVLRARMPDAEVVVSDFESWVPHRDRFALVCAAQSWHWVRSDVGAPKAAELLRPGGWLAVWWNRPATDEHPIQLELNDVYARLAPTLAHTPGPNTSARNAAALFETDGRYGPVTSHVIEWAERYTTAQYLELMTTQSPHRLLADDELDALLRGIAEVLDRHGGVYEHPYITRLVAAPRRV